MTQAPDSKHDRSKKEGLAYLFRLFKQRGAVWFWRRIRREIWAAETSLGKKTTRILRVLHACLIRSRSYLLLNFYHKNHSMIVIYDLNIRSVTYDFIYVLAAAEYWRQMQNFKQIDLYIIADRKRLYGRELAEYRRIITQENQEQRVFNILLGCARLLPSIEDVHILRCRADISRWQKMYKLSALIPDYYCHYAHDIDFAYQCFRTVNRQTDASIMSLTASAYRRAWMRNWLAGNDASERAVVLGLREYDYTPMRNSDVTQWQKFAQWLLKRGYQPVVIPDEATSQQTRRGFGDGVLFFPEAVLNVETRMAAYQEAFLSMSVNSGPHFLAFLCRQTRAIMVKTDSTTGTVGGAEYRRRLGFELGQQLRYATPFQRMVNREDKFPILVEEFQRMEQIIINSLRNNHV